MKTIITIFATAILFGCTVNNSDSDDDLRRFNQFLGSEKAQVLDETVDSFHHFLDSNYPNGKSLSAQTLSFIEEFNTFHNKDSAWKWINPTWKMDADNNEAILNKWEDSGLRKEIWLYGLELRELDRGEVAYTDTSMYTKGERWKQAIRDSLLHDNVQGDYISGLKKYTPKNEYFQGYWEYQEASLTTPYAAILVPGLIQNDVDLADPFIQRILVVDVFMQVIDKDLEIKKRKTTRQQWLKKHAATL